jgi:Ca2+-binding RTX toxin-like protein
VNESAIALHPRIVHSRAHTVKNRTFGFALAAVALSFALVIQQAPAAVVLDPALNVTIRRTNQNVLLSWFGSNAVSYQVESSSNFMWTNSSSVITGAGGFLFVTNSINAQGRAFYQVKRFLPVSTITAAFNAATGVLTVTGDDLDNTINVGRDVAGTILVNNGAVSITGGTPTVANTMLIEIFGRAGNDQLSLDESNGALPRANLFGEADHDTLTGGSGADALNGGPGNDTLLGKGGADTLFGGDDNDTLTGGDADDQVFGEAGNDRLVWNPGDDTDLNEGGDGTDTVEVNGGGGAEQFTTTANGLRVRFDRLDPAPFSIDIGTCENLALNANGGNDSFSATGNLAALIQITVDGGAGDDMLLGSNGIDLLLGGDNNDFIDGQQGNDVVFGGDGNDTFQWDPGDGSDTLEGQAGNDKLLFNGSAGAEIYDASANGTRVRFTRNLGNIVMDLDDVETLDLNALGGIDMFTVNDLSGTDLTSITVDLALSLGGSAGDGAVDTLIVNGTSGDDIITATLPNGELFVSGLAASVLVEHFETTLDTVRIQGFDGHDVLDASAVDTGGPLLVLDGGLGDDILLGGMGNDNLLGGDNDDVLFGGGGVDTLDGGLGENVLSQDGFNVTTGIVSVFGDNTANTITISRDVSGNILSNGVPITGATVANTALIRVFGIGGDDAITLNEVNGALPAAMLFGGAGVDSLSGGTGSDLIFGGIDNDTLLGRGGFDFLFGGGGSDILTGGDADDQVFGEAGNDRFVWNPGDDTDLNEGGSGTDTVEVNGGNGAEQFTTTANGARVRFDRINPAPFAIDIGTCENLVLNANGGDDSFSATGNLAALIQITVDGGAGNDTILGSNGIDLLSGGDGDDFIDGQQGNDFAFGGADNDTFQWDPGDGNDTLEGQAGTDVMVFNGSAGAEIMEAAANGARLRFTRNLGNIVMDVDGVERVECKLLGGIDNFVVNKLDGTAVTQIDLDLAAIGGGSDGQPDLVILNSTAAVDTFNLAANAGVVEASGLGALVRVSGGALSNDVISITGVSNDVVNINGSTNADSMTVTANGTSARVDATGFTVPVNVSGALRLAINGLGGMDNIACTGNLAAIVPLTLDGGDDNDTILGSNGADILLGGAGDDFIDGQQGNDFAFGGADNDTFQWDPGDGSDTVEGQAGTDVMVFNGSAGSEIMEASANGARLRFTRNLGNVVMDVDDVERVDCNLLGSADTFTVNSLAGTDVTQVNLNLAGTLGGSSGDAQIDTITINGTAAGDAFNVSAISGAVNVTGITPAVRITDSEAANDSVIINGLGGTDLFNIGSGVSSLIMVTTNQ